MNYYLLLLVYIISANIFCYKNSKLCNSIFSLEALILIMLIGAAIRGNGNGDYFNYLSYSNGITNLNQVFFPSKGYPMEFYFRVISYIKNLLQLPSQFIVFIMNSTSLYLLYNFIKKNSQNPQLSILLYYPFYLYFDLHHMRAGIAVIVGLYMLKAILNKEYIISVIFLLIALMFHRTALILLIALIGINLGRVLNIQNKFSGFPITKFLTIIIFMFVVANLDLIDLFIKSIGNATTSFPYINIFITKMQTYLHNPDYGYQFRMSDPRLILMILTYFLIILFYDYSSYENNTLLGIYFISLVIMLLFSGNTLMTLRLSAYFSIIKVILIPNLMVKFNKAYSKIKYYNVTKFLLLFLFVSICIILSQKQVPYKIFSIYDQFQF